MRTIRWKRGIAVAAALVLGSVAVLGAFRFERAAPEKAPAPQDVVVSEGRVRIAPTAPSWKVLKVQDAKPAEVRWGDAVPGRVKIDDRLASKVGVPVSGRVTRVFADLGQRVKAGDALFSVTSQDIADLRAQKEKAAVDMDAASAGLERVKAMVAAHALPAKEELAAQQATKQAEVSLRLACAKLSSLRVASPDGEAPNEFVVTSPRDGVVVEKNLVADQVVQPDASATLMVVADLSSVWIVAELFEADAVDVREGAEAEVSSPLVPGFKLKASVDMVSAIVDPSRHTVPIRVRVPNRDLALRPNAYAHVRFSTRPATDAVDVPATALVSDGARQYVYVRADSQQFARREVVAGPTVAGRTTILSGLKAGEELVTEGAILLDNLLSAER